MKIDDDILMLYSIIGDLGHTGIGHESSKRKSFFFTKTVPKLVDDIQNNTFIEITGDSDGLQGEGVKMIIPSNIIDIYTRLDVLLGLKLFGHTNIFTETITLIDEL